MKRKQSEAGFVTLIELLVVTALIIVVVYLVYGQHGGAGAGPAAGVVSPEQINPGGQAQTVPGAALERARALECQENLRGARQMISTYRLGGDELPKSLEEIPGVPRTCPVSHNPYVYDPQTGTIRCTTPGHESF